MLKARAATPRAAALRKAPYFNTTGHMKRKTSIEGSASTSSSSPSPVRGSDKPTRVSTIAGKLRADGVGPDQYPTQGRVRAYLSDEDHVHDPRDEPELIDWCVSVGATTLLSDGLAQWRRDSLRFQGTEVAQVLTAGITAALDAGAKRIAVARCLPGPRSNQAGNQGLVLALVRAVSECEALTLEDFRLLTPQEVCQFLDFAGGHCLLTQLSLSRVSGMGIDAMDRLVLLVLKSNVLCLCLGEADPDALAVFLATLGQLSEGENLCLTRLDISYAVAGDTEGRMTAKAQRQSDDIDLQLVLLRSRHKGLEINAKRILVVPDDRPTRSDEPDRPQPAHSVSGMLLHISAYCPGTPPDHQVTLDPQFDLECFDTDGPPGPHGPYRGIEWNPRVLRRPGFLADIGRGLAVRWLAEESLPTRTMQPRVQALEMHSPRIAYALTEGEPSTLRWIRTLDRDHRDLWDDTYARHLEALVREDTQAIEEMDALLTGGATFDLIAYVEHLRARGQLPAADRIAALLKRHDDNPALRTVGLWAFEPLQAIDELVGEGKIGQLQMWANTLKRVDALPPLEALQPLFHRYADREDILQALFCLLPE